MVEKILVTAYVIFLLATGQVPFNHNSWTDRVDPNVQETVSYARVPENSQDYRNVQVIDPANGQKRPYRIEKVGGYDPSRQYIAIEHKGQYVRQITYISKEKFMSAAAK